MDELHKCLEPIKKKWVYHFIVSPKTSVIEKPEWYFGQTRKWIYEHIDTIEPKIKSVPDDASCPHVKHQFILCMIELVLTRLTKDIKKISSHIAEDLHYEAILVHTYNEVILFTKTIRRLLGDCFMNIHDRHDLLSVFSEQKLFETIVDIEWEYAEKNLKDITTSPIKWDPILDGEFVDNYKIPKCVDRFLMMIGSLTERVECFRQIDCQFKLVELQCFLFNKFLKFLQKSSEDTKTRGTKLFSELLFGGESTIDMTRKLRILNAVNFMRLILKDRYFIPDSLISVLDVTLLDKSDKLSQDYKSFFYRLVSTVVSIYANEVDEDLQDFLDFIKPKLSPHIYEIIHEDVSKIHQERHTKNLLGGLSIHQY